MSLRIAFGSIFLNEAQFLPFSLAQHYAFCDKWFFIEGADVRYPRESVTDAGLSTDKSAEIIKSYPDIDKKITLIQHGWAQDKTVLRNRYAELADMHRIDILIVVDIDEFLTNSSMVSLLTRLRQLPGPGVVRIPHVHFWHNQQTVITGKYWDVPHDRAYRWQQGNRYIRDHNHPEKNGLLLRARNTDAYMSRRVVHNDGSMTCDEPFWLHYANCKEDVHVQDKNAFYRARGEAQTRPETIKSREAFFSVELPEGLVTYKWAGPLPEVMR